jgi:NAD(P)H-dependent flavin oxidoreductase YrpB (nitropropane dioxygenase family)
VAKNSISDQVVEILRAGGDFESVRELVAGRRGRTVYETGDLEAGIWWAGLSQALVDDLPTCRQLIEQMIGDAEQVIGGRLAAMVR